MAALYTKVAALRKFFNNLRAVIAEKHQQLAKIETYDATIEYLVAENEIDAKQARALRITLPRQVGDSRYILNNLGAHLGIGVVFAFDVIPLPLGTIGRVSWVAGSRCVETYRRNTDRARVHSLTVFLVAAIPWIGYAAYLIPLKKGARELNYLLANQIVISRVGKSLNAYLSTRSKFFGMVGEWLAPTPDSLKTERHKSCS